MRTWLLFTALGLGLLVPSSRASGTSAAAELRQLAEHYRALGRYADRGEILVTEVDGMSVVRREEHRFETLLDGDTFLLRLVATDRRVAVWRQGDQARHYDSRSGESRDVPTPSAGLARLLDWGDGTHELLFVPLLLAEPAAGRMDPETAEDRGERPCGDGSCRILTASYLGGSVGLTYAIDTRTGLLSSLEVRARKSSDVMARALAEAGLGRSAASRSFTLLEARWSSVRTEGQIDIPRFDPGKESFWMQIAIAGDSVPAPSATGPVADRAPTPDGADADLTVREEIEVTELQTEIRVLQPDGSPVLGLSRENFVARAGGRRLEVVAVDWVSPEQPLGSDIPPEVRARYDIVVDPRRFIVFFVQADLDRSRAVGHLKILPRVRRMLEEMRPDDWVAVASFDSHLKLRSDFTTDRETTAAALEAAIRFGPAEPPVAARFPSLGRHLDERDALRAATPEKALEHVAESLSHLPGGRIVVYVGWGLGRYGIGGVTMTPEYTETRAALARGDITVFVLDVTQADYHSLEIGLRQVAEDTGGKYESTFHFPDLATQALTRTLSGHYLVTVAVPDDLPGRKRLKLSLTGAKGELYAPPTWVGTVR